MNIFYERSELKGSYAVQRAYFKEKEEEVEVLKSQLKKIRKGIKIVPSIFKKPEFYLYFNHTTGELLSFFPHTYSLTIKYKIKRDQKIAPKVIKGSLEDLSERSREMIKKLEKAIAALIIYCPSLNGIKRDYFKQILRAYPVGTFLKMQAGLSLVADHEELPYTLSERVLFFQANQTLLIAEVEKIKAEKIVFSLGSGKIKIDFNKLSSAVMFREADSSPQYLNVWYHEAKMLTEEKLIARQSANSES